MTGTSLKVITTANYVQPICYTAATELPLLPIDLDFAEWRRPRPPDGRDTWSLPRQAWCYHKRFLCASNADSLF